MHGSILNPGSKTGKKAKQRGHWFALEKAEPEFPPSLVSSPPALLGGPPWLLGVRAQRGEKQRKTPKRTESSYPSSLGRLLVRTFSPKVSPLDAGDPPGVG